LIAREANGPIPPSVNAGTEFNFLTNYGVKLHTVTAYPGLVVVDSSLNLVASNSEGLDILAFPKISVHTESRCLAEERIRSQLLLSHPVNASVRDFRSGSRLYICRSFPVDLAWEAERGPAYVLMFERRTATSLTLEEICTRYGLTPRERQVVHFLVQGLTSKEIASRMNISAHTVKAFLRLVMVKMNVFTRSGIIGKIAGTQL
jgi:DNA-binding CsgD family transcriptional regulator